MQLFGGKRPISTGNSIPLYHQNRYDPGGLIKYINTNLMARPQMPKMSADLEREIRRSFVDVFDNIFTHSNSPMGGLACGQVYPKAKEIQLVGEIR